MRAALQVYHVVEFFRLMMSRSALHRKISAGAWSGAIVFCLPMVVAPLCTTARAAEPSPASDRSVALADCEAVLEKAGAGPAELAQFEQQTNRASTSDLRSYEAYIRELSSAWVAEMVGNLRYAPDDQYVSGADSLPRPGVPKGKTIEFNFDDSRVFPGTTRRITVYVPAEYTAARPACVYVGLDALGFEAPTVFDNLISKHEMPVTIAIGVAPGVLDSARAPEDPRHNRSLEFDGLSGDLGTFLLEEVFPEVERRKTPDGRPIRLSKDPNDRAVGGASTGGIGAFTLAWEHPDYFRRVFTAIGTFVGMRGGDHYPVIIRKTEPKPIRIFMQDGSHDQLTYFLGEVGDWWLSNQAMLSALTFAGYSVRHAWGEGTHNGKHATMVFPDAMRWLWQDWPQPVAAGESQNVLLRQILLTGETWQSIPGNYRCNGGLSPNRNGEVYFRDVAAGKNWKITPDGARTEDAEIRSSYSSLAFGPDGRAYLSDGTAATIVARGANGQDVVVAAGVHGSNLLVTDRGNVYVTESGDRVPASGKVWLVRPTGEKLLLDGGLHGPGGIALSPDGLWLAVVESQTHWGYSYRVQPDGTVQDKQRFYWFHVPDGADDSGASGCAMDREGLFYVGTRMGVQVFDRNGRSRAILPVPGGAVTGLAFGGPGFDNLYVSCDDHKVYRRRLKLPGVPAWTAPIKLPLWGAG